LYSSVLLMLRRLPLSLLFPYTTLFRSSLVTPLVLLVITGAMTALLGWRSFVRRHQWTGTRLEMTNDLVERMVGHRTRLAQEPSSDRKSTRLNSSHEWISYAVVCLKKKH